MADKYNAEQLHALMAKGHTFPDTTSYPIDDAEDLDAAVQAVGRGGADHDAIRRYVMHRAEAMGMSDKIPADWNPDGSLKAGRSDELTLDDELVELLTDPQPCERTFTLDDISIRAGGDGRTVTAYAAIFDTPAEIHDQDGHYVETIDPVAFNRTVAARAGRIGVFYNHGKTLYGTPSERFSMPLGTPEDIRADRRGLLTVTRYNRNPLADEILESIRNGDITGQSFSGKFISSKRTRDRSGGLDQIHRSEVALREYGPTPMPAYKEAAVLGVRMEELVDTWRALTDAQRDELQTLLDTSRSGESAPTGTLAQGTEPVIPTPASHVGPTPEQRRNRLATLKGILT